MVSIWFLYGVYVVSIWFLCGFSIVSIWFLYGFYMVSIRFLYGFYTRETIILGKLQTDLNSSAIKGGWFPLLTNDSQWGRPVSSLQFTQIIHCWLVAYLPLWKIWKSIGITIPRIWKKIRNVTGHQPDWHMCLRKIKGMSHLQQQDCDHQEINTHWKNPIAGPLVFLFEMTDLKHVSNPPV